LTGVVQRIASSTKFGIKPASALSCGEQGRLFGQHPHRGGGGVGGGVVAGGREYREVGDRAAVLHGRAVDLGVGEQASRDRRAASRRRSAMSAEKYSSNSSKTIFQVRGCCSGCSGSVPGPAQVRIGPAEQPLGETSMRAWSARGTPIASSTTRSG
jgi:hypothetical protein